MSYPYRKKYKEYPKSYGNPPGPDQPHGYKPKFKRNYYDRYEPSRKYGYPSYSSYSSRGSTLESQTPGPIPPATTPTTADRYNDGQGASSSSFSDTTYANDRRLKPAFDLNIKLRQASPDKQKDTKADRDRYVPKISDSDDDDSGKRVRAEENGDVKQTQGQDPSKQQKSVSEPPKSPEYPSEQEIDSDAETVVSDSVPSTDVAAKMLKDLNTEKIRKPYILKRDASGSGLLQRACKRGNLDEVKDLIKRGADPNESDFCGFTCLHEAALNGNTEIVKFLIKHGADVNKQALPDGDLETPLIDAADNKHLEIVQVLLENGADPKIFNNDGFTALTKIHNLHRDEEGYDEIIRLLEDATNQSLSRDDQRHGINGYGRSVSPNSIIEDPHDNYFSDLLKKKSQSALIYKYAAEGIKDLTALYIVEGGRLDYKPDILILASRNGHLELVDIILGLVEGYDINSSNKVGLTALLASVGRGHLAVVEFLLERGGNPFLRRKPDGLNALEISQLSANFDPKEVEVLETFMKKNPNYLVLTSDELKQALKRTLDDHDNKKLKRTKTNEDVRKSNGDDLKKVKSEVDLKKVKSIERNKGLDYDDKIESGIKPTTSTLFQKERTPDLELVSVGGDKDVSLSPRQKVHLHKVISQEEPELSKEQEEQRAKSARDLKMYQDKLEAKKRAKRDLFLKSEKEKEKRRKEEELKMMEEKAKMKQLAIEQKQNKIQEIQNEAKKIENVRSNLIKKLTRENYPIGLRNFKFGIHTDTRAILKYCPMYILTINNTKYVIDLQVSLITGLRPRDVLNISSNVIEASIQDKCKLWNLFMPLIGYEGVVSKNAITDSFDKFKHLSMKLILYQEVKGFLGDKYSHIHELIFEAGNVINVDFESLNVFDDNKQQEPISNGAIEPEVFLPPNLSRRPQLAKLIKQTQTPLW